MAALDQLPEDLGLSPRRRYLVGVSGGRDSVALLDWLHAGGCDKLVVCHLNHGLRARAAAADEKFVARLAAERGLAFETAKVDVKALAKERGQSLETAGRQARHEFFSLIAADQRCPRVLLAHHADDQAETVLMNLFRGSATLSGMKPEQEIKVGRRKLQLLRPLLPVWREEIDQYITARGLKFREDASNSSAAFLRNRVRHELMPQLRDLFQRDVGKAVVRAAQIAAAEDELLASRAEGLSPEKELSVAKLRALDLALQRRVVHRWLRERGIADVGFVEVERVLTMLSDEKTAKVNLPGSAHARRRAGKLFVEVG